nr:sigma-1-small protein [Mammalian orthoreovirus]
MIMGRHGRSRKSRNRLNNLVLMSAGSVSSLRHNKESLMMWLRESQPLKQDMVILAIEFLQTSDLSPHSQRVWAQSMRVYPPWVSESMLQNNELRSWIQSRLISLEEHPYWKEMYQH